MEGSTKDRLIEAGMTLLLQRGYNHLGIQDILDATKIPKGSFYHHFESKEDFALAVIDRYMGAVHEGLDGCLQDSTRPPLARIRNFFELTTQAYEKEGYLGCLLGGLGQELSGVNPVFRGRIEKCLGQIGQKIETCLTLAVERGELAGSVDAAQLANLLVNCWEGAALRTRLLRNPAPLRAMLDFYFAAMAPPVVKSAARRRSTRKRA